MLWRPVLYNATYVQASRLDVFRREPASSSSERPITPSLSSSESNATLNGSASMYGCSKSKLDYT